MATDNHTPEPQKRVAELLRAAAQNERAPESLHARIAAMRDESEPARQPRRPRGFVLARLAMPMAAAAAAVIVLALGGGAGAPSIAQAASLGTRSPTAPAPAPDRSHPTQLLSAEVGTLHFPNWQAAAGWRSVGQRHDHVGNRSATTVYYASGATEVAYSIVSSPTLSGLRTQNGEPYGTIAQNGRTTVVWEEARHTCLLSARGMSPVQLWQLATSGFRKPLRG